MIAQLKVYGNAASPEPTKVYNLYRITPYTLGLIQDYVTKEYGKAFEDGNEQEVIEEAGRFLRIFFPEITNEEIYMLDYGTNQDGQFYEFVNAIAEYGNKEGKRAVKN